MLRIQSKQLIVFDFSHVRILILSHLKPITKTISQINKRANDERQEIRSLCTLSCSWRTFRSWEDSKGVKRGCYERHPKPSAAPAV